MKIRRTLEALSEDELRAWLRLMLMQIRSLEKEGFSREAIEALLSSYKDIASSASSPKDRSISPNATHVHIVAGLSFAGSMKHTLQSLGWSDHHEMIVMEEDYAMGPLGMLDSPEGRQARSDWFRNHIVGGADAYTFYEDDYLKVLRQIQQIPEQAQVVIWTSDNATEQLGMRHALYLLSNRPNAVAVNDACLICEQLHDQPGIVIKYRHSGEIAPDKLGRALRQTVDSLQTMTEEEIERLRLEWQHISEGSHALRVWKAGKVVEVAANVYDDYLLNKLDILQQDRGSGNFLKAARVIGEAIGNCDQYISDAYFEYRLRTLIYDGVLEIQGVPAAMRYYSVRRKIQGVLS